jgi:diguanylate cyclase (GGDEF)-like protein
MKNKLDLLILAGTFLLFIVGISLFSYFEYQHHKTILYRQIDERLRIAAQTTNTLLTPHFQDRTVEATAISPSEDRDNIHRLSEFAKNMGVVYVYSIIQKGDKIYFTASSATDNERTTGRNLTHYYDCYEDASETLKKAFQTQYIQYDEYTDKWGKFRSVFIPMHTPNGALYVIGADISIDTISEELRQEAFSLLLRLFGTIALSFPFLTWYLRRLNNDLKREKHILAHFDQLTGLPNRILLNDRIHALLHSSHRDHESLAVMLVDLDHFKDINDTLGHTVGDGVLIETAKRIQSTLGEEDIASRLSGDEFILLFPDTDANKASHIALKLLETLSQIISIEQNDLILTASIGIALYPYDGEDFETLLKNADTAMHQVKGESRNDFYFFTPEMQVHFNRNLQLVNALRHVLKRNELEVYYQPQISLETGEIIGAEALLRWHHPLWGMMPAEFIPIAEESGQIIAIGEWVLRTTMEQLKGWIERGFPPMVIAVNLSTVQFRQKNLVELVMNILQDTGVPPSYLELELTEACAMVNQNLAIKVMDKLHEQGIRMAIDDFGTGYSSLSYLKKFKVSKLKIDQSFIRDVVHDSDDQTIVTTIINMARNLGLKTIAEGVETSEQLAFLRLHGCDEIQGYYFSKPLPVAEFEAFIHTFNRL